MAATVQFGEDNGAPTATPKKGTTRTFGRGEANWKNVDDSTTAYSASPITAGNFSYPKYQFAIFSGSFNTISNAKWGHTSGSVDSSLTIWARTGVLYAVPAAALIGTGTNVTVPSGLGAASFSIIFNTAGPEQADSTTLTSSGYSCYLVHQLQTTASSPAGDLATGTTWSLQFDES